MRRFAAYLLAVLLPTAVFAQDDDGGFLERLLEDNLSGAGRDVQIRGFAGALSSQATIEQLTIADGEGVWLTLEDVVLDWSRLALLRGRVEVNSLTAGSIQLPRLPVASEDDVDLPDPEASGFRLPELPVSVNIGEISTPTISIGEPVFGIASDFSLSGSLMLEGGEGAADFEIARLDGPEGTLDLEVEYSNETTVLDLSIALAEDPGGILATLAGIPGEPAVDLSLEGQGPLDDFSASLSLTTDGTERLAGTVRIGGEGTVEGGPLPFRAELSGDIAPLLVPDYADFFGDNVSLVLAGVRGADGALDFRTFTLDARQISLDGNLSLTPAGLPSSFDLAGQVRSDTGEPVLLPFPGDPTRVQGVTLSAAFDAAQGDAWQGRFAIEQLDRPGFSAESIELDGDGTISADGSFTMNFDFSADALDLGDPNADAALGERVAGRLELSRAPDAPLEISRLEVTGETYGFEAAATLDIADRDLSVEGRSRVSVADLSVFSGIAGRPLAGAAELSVEGSGQVLGGAFDVSVSGRTTDLSVGVPQVDNIVRGATALTIEASRGADGISLDVFRLGSSTARITADGSIRTDGSSINVSAALDDGTLVLPGLEGRHSLALIAEDVGELWTIRSSLRGDTLSGVVEGQLDLAPTLPAFEGLVTLDAASLGPLGPLVNMPGLGGSLSLRLEGQIDGDLSAFDVTLDGTGDGLTTGMADLDPLLAGGVALNLDAARAAGPIEIRSLEASTQTISVDAAGTVSGLPAALIPFDPAALDLSATAFDGRVNVSASDLSPAAAIIGLPDLGGAVDGSLAANAVFDLSSFDIVLGLNGAGLRTGLPQLDPLLRGDVTVDLDASRDGEPVIIDAFDLSTESIDASLMGTLTGLPVALLPPDTAAMMDTARFDGSARIVADDLAPLGPLAGLPGLGGALRATVDGEVTANLETLDVKIDANGANLRTGIAAIDSYIGGGTVLGIDVRRADGRLDIRQGRFASPGLTAQLEGTVGPRDGSIDATVRLDDLGRIVEGFSGRATATVSVQRTAGNPWTVDADVDGPGGMALRADGTVAPEFDSVNLDVTGQAPLGLANTFIAPRSLGGQAAFDLRVSGPPALSSVSGRITTSDARLVAPTFGFVIDRADATVTLSGERAVLDVRGNVAGGGQVAVSGPISLSPPLNTDLDVVLTRVRLTDPKLFETTVDGRISVNGPLSGGASITGQVNVGRTEIRIPSGVSGGTAPIPEITHLSEPADVRLTRERAGLLNEDGPEESGGSGRAFPLDVRVSAPNQIFIRGRGLDAELGGSFRITGTSENVIPQGQLDLIRGRLDILGKRITLKEGSVAIQGDFDPYVRLVAESQANDITVFVIVDGPVSEPEIRFESQPELPEDEVIAQLLFGRGIDNISPFQAAQLASAVATLTGGGDGLLGGLRTGFGLDELDIATDEEGGLAVTAGKYLSDNLYTDVTVNSEGETELRLNLDLSPSVTVSGLTRSTGESGVGIYFERDY